MRTPDQDGTGADTVSSSVGDGFGASADDLEDGFGADDFSDDSFGDGTDGGPFGSGSDHDVDGDTPFGDGLSDAEAKNVLVEILEDVFGSDSEALDETSAGVDPSGDGGLFEAFAGVQDMFGDVDDPFEPTDLPSDSDFDLTSDGHVDVHDLHEAEHPFDFDVTE
ncbi:MAG TPA: hypothetical protein VIL36_03415 [Acidimicrobiales bacterium]